MSRNSRNILNHFASAIVIVVLLVPFLTQAQDTRVNAGPKIENPFKYDTIEQLIETIINDIILPIGGVVAALMIIWAGFLYVTARGDPGQIKKAHDALLFAVIGAAILLGAWVISRAISATIDQLKKP